MELQFTIGECLSCIGSGQTSKIFKRRYDNAIDLKAPTDDVMTSVIHKIIKEVIHSPLAQVRQAGVVWLLSIVQHSSLHVVVRKEMKLIQKAFIVCMCDPDDVTQDVVSRGLLFVLMFIYFLYFLLYLLC